MDRITLDRSVFKALASDTRLDILKALDERQKTGTELSRELELNKATVHEHLAKLEEVGLVQRIDDERKWVYWQLSWKGRRLLHPEKITLAVLLSTAMGSLATAVAAFWLWTTSGRDASGLPQDTAGDARIESAPLAAPVPEASDAAAAGDPMLLWVGIGMAVLFVVLLFVAWGVLRWAKVRASDLEMAA